MRASVRFLIPTVAASLLLGACGSSSSSSSSSTASPAASGGSSALVKTAAISSLGGTVLVNARGLTLYRLSGEQGGEFICTSATCLKAWHPLVVRSGSKPTGSVGSLGVVRRSNNGSEQVTYKGMPLYTFALDTAPGQAKGQGIKDVGTWNAVTTTASTSASSTTSTSTTKPYGY